jgi:UDPglucose 6-dehydrogenase
MNVTVLGAGYVGLVASAGLADFGLNVTTADIDPEKIRLLSQGQLPFFEPQLAEIVQRNIQVGRLRFSTDVGGTIADSQVIFIAVGTDAGPGGMPDMRYVWAAADTLAERMNGYKVIVMKSTVPVGTGAELQKRIASRLQSPVEFDVVSNPEFLREGSAVEDFFHPNRVVIGTNSERAAAVMRDIYRPLYLIETPFVFTTRESAELIKYAANSFLALKVSFVNELANLCDAVGPSADIHVVAKALGLDRRIGPKFLHPGPGFGGYCFPKDTRALCQIARQFGVEIKTIEAAVAVNDAQFLHVVAKVRTGLGGLKGKTVAVLGLSFKPNTDDVRESRSIAICKALLDEGASIRAYDPVAAEQCARVLHHERLTYCKDSYSSAEGCDALVVATEWNEFRNVDMARIKSLMRGDLLIDARNIYESSKAKAAGFRYFGVGRQ